VLSIPEALWSDMLDRFEQSPRDVERVAYLDGIQWIDSSGTRHGVVTTVVIPNAILTAGNYRVPAEAIAEAGRHMFNFGLIRLLQVHTHGNDWTNHSWVDDEMAYTRKEGGLSIVLPFHAHGRPVPEEGGVHVRDRGRWRRLNRHEIREVVRLVPSLRDFRLAPRRRWRWWPWSR
jgi:hypothetical protein